MATSNLEKSAFLFNVMPSFDDVLIYANEKLEPFRYKLGKRMSAMKPRRNKCYRIGPIAPFSSVRVYRTIDGFVEDFARNHGGRAREIWIDLEGVLRSISANVEPKPDADRIRKDYYRFEIEGRWLRFEYGHFERIFSRSRKRVKTLGELAVA